MGIPANERIQAALTKWKCTARVTHNAYDIVNEHGDAIDVPFGASVEQWEAAAEAVGAYRV